MKKDPIPADANHSPQDTSLTARFETHRRHLLAVAYRLLGSLSEAEDAVQETWLRLNRAEPSKLTQLGGWLTTVIARICLDMLRARQSRREVSLEDQLQAPASGQESGSDPAQEALLADAVGVALLVVLERLSPAERIAFVLHDLFELPFDEIAVIVGRSTTATRQLASRARRRVKLGETEPASDQTHKWKVVDAFLAASRSGDLKALLAVLDPQVVFEADPTAVRLGMGLGAQSEIHGSQDVATFYHDVAEFYNKRDRHKERAGGLQPAWIEGAPGLVGIFNGTLMAALKLSLPGDRISGIQAIADREHLSRLDWQLRDTISF